MIAIATRLVKELFPKLALQLRVMKLLAKRVDPDMYFLANLRKYLLNSHETRHFASYFTGENTAIDVGACGGEYSCVMARSFKKVLSIEPTPEMASKLRVSLPANCEGIECAMGKVSGEVGLRIPKVGDARMHALATIADHDFDFSNIGLVDVTMVQQITIDKLVGERNLRPSFIKIDVEGYEGDVLSGCTATIDLCRPVLLIEIEKRHNKHFREIFSFLNSYGYIPYHFRDGKLQRSSPNVVDESYDYLIARGVTGMADVIASRASEKYINNFLFLPASQPAPLLNQRG